MKRVHAPGGEIKRLRLTRTAYAIEGMFAYDSITVSYAWELTSVSMRYSQGEGVNTSLSRIMYCTHVSYIVSFRSLPVCVYGYLPWHGHVLPGTLIIKTMCINQLYLQG